MGSNDDWWQRKLSGASPRTAIPPTTYTPTPPHAPPQAFPTPSLPGQPAPQQVAPSQFWSYDANGNQVPDDGHVANLHNAALATGGSKRSRGRIGTCPECGGGNYFSRDLTESGTPYRNPASTPVPRCYDCGYPNIQSSSQTGGATQASRSTGGPPADVRRSRQLARNHSVVAYDGKQTIIFPPASR